VVRFDAWCLGRRGGMCVTRPAGTQAPPAMAFLKTGGGLAVYLALPVHTDVDAFRHLASGLEKPFAVNQGDAH